ncbi:MAG: hypothetical protein ABSG64_12330 [Solirubrobacteraceae bacterium]
MARTVGLHRGGRRALLATVALALAAAAAVIFALPARSSAQTAPYTCIPPSGGFQQCSYPLSTTVGPCPAPNSSESGSTDLDIALPSQTILTGNQAPTTDAPATVACGGGVDETVAVIVNAPPTPGESVPTGQIIVRITWSANNPAGGADPGGESPSVKFNITFYVPECYATLAAAQGIGKPSAKVPLHAVMFKSDPEHATTYAGAPRLMYAILASNTSNQCLAGEVSIRDVLPKSFDCTRTVVALATLGPPISIIAMGKPLKPCRGRHQTITVHPGNLPPGDAVIIDAIGSFATAGNTVNVATASADNAPSVTTDGVHVHVLSSETQYLQALGSFLHTAAQLRG